MNSRTWIALKKFLEIPRKKSTNEENLPKVKAQKKYQEKKKREKNDNEFSSRLISINFELILIWEKLNKQKKWTFLLPSRLKIWKLKKSFWTFLHSRNVERKWFLCFMKIMHKLFNLSLLFNRMKNQKGMEKKEK